MRGQRDFVQTSNFSRLAAVRSQEGSFFICWWRSRRRSGLSFARAWSGLVLYSDLACRHATKLLVPYGGEDRYSARASEKPTFGQRVVGSGADNSFLAASPAGEIKGTASEFVASPQSLACQLWYMVTQDTARMIVSRSAKSEQSSTSTAAGPMEDLGLSSPPGPPWQKNDVRKLSEGPRRSSSVESFDLGGDLDLEVRLEGGRRVREVATFDAEKLDSERTAGVMPAPAEHAGPATLHHDDPESE